MKRLIVLACFVLAGACTSSTTEDSQGYTVNAADCDIVDNSLSIAGNQLFSGCRLIFNKTLANCTWQFLVDPNQPGTPAAPGPGSLSLTVDCAAAPPVVLNAIPAVVALPTASLPGGASVFYTDPNGHNATAVSGSLGLTTNDVGAVGNGGEFASVFSVVLDNNQQIMGSVDAVASTVQVSNPAGTHPCSVPASCSSVDCFSLQPICASGSVSACAQYTTCCTCH